MRQFVIMWFCTYTKVVRFNSRILWLKCGICTVG